MTRQLRPSPELPESVTTADALRGRIDGGGGNDKVNFPDPAASPLGTDDEAAGMPPTPSDVTRAAAHELSRQAADAPADTSDRVSTDIREGRGIPAWVWMLAALLIAGGLIAAVLPLA